MGVLLLADAFYPCPQSSSQRLYSFAKALSLRGFKVTVITAIRCFKKMRGAPLNKDFLVFNIKYPRLMMSVSSVLINPILLLLYFFAAVNTVLRERIDTILVSVPNGEGAIVGFFVSKIFGIPLIIDMRDIYPPPSIEFPSLPRHVPTWMNEILIAFFQLLYKNSARAHGRIVCAYTKIRDDLVKEGISPEKILFIPNGADISIYAPCSPEKRERTRSKYGLGLDKFIFVYAGSLFSYYAVIEVIKGLKRVLPRKKDVELLVISFTSYASHKRTTEKLKLEDKVKFLGPLPITETAKILSACDVGLVPHSGEDYYKDFAGAKIFSYMSCGLPILASGTLGSFIENFIHEHKIGFFVGRPDENNFAKGFLHFLENKSEVENMGHNARRTIEDFYDRKKLGLKLASLVEVIQKEKNGVRR